MVKEEAETFVNKKNEVNHYLIELINEKEKTTDGFVTLEHLLLSSSSSSSSIMLSYRFNEVKNSLRLKFDGFDYGDLEGDG